MQNEYCPNGNYWEDVTGIFDKRIYMFCDCDICKGKLYELRPTDVTNKVTKEMIKEFRNIIKLKKTKRQINTDNMEDVLKIINKYYEK